MRRCLTPWYLPSHVKEPSGDGQTYRIAPTCGGRAHGLSRGHAEEAAAQSMARFHRQRTPAGAAIAAVFHMLNDSPTGSRPLMLHWSHAQLRRHHSARRGTGPRHPGTPGRPLLVRPDLGLTGTSRDGGKRDVVDGHAVWPLPGDRVVLGREPLSSRDASARPGTAAKILRITAGLAEHLAADVLCELDCMRGPKLERRSRPNGTSVGTGE